MTFAYNFLKFHHFLAKECLRISLMTFGLYKIIRKNVNFAPWNFRETILLNDKNCVDFEKIFVPIIDRGRYAENFCKYRIRKQYFLTRFIQILAHTLKEETRWQT